MNQILLYSILAGGALIVGALLGLVLKLSQKMTAILMAFGSGVFICALTFGLMEEAFKHGGFDAVIIGFLLGGIIFTVGDYFILKSGGRRHKNRHHAKESAGQVGEAITLGAILDALPESIALGIALLASQSSGLLMLVAIVLNNLPESLTSAPGLRKEGFSKKNIILFWVVVAISSIWATLISFVFLKNVDPNIIGILEAFAAGAILAMLSNTMMPDAYKEGGIEIGFVTVLGFLTAFIISRY